MIRNTLFTALLVLSGCVSAPALAQTLGPEKVVNGDFAAGGGWTLGYSWQTIPGAMGVAFHNEGYTAPIEQATTALTGGTTYRVSYTISGSYTSTDPRHWFRMRGTFGFKTCPVGSGDGTFSCDLAAPTGVSSFQLRPGSGLGAVLDDVSIREVLP